MKLGQAIKVAKGDLWVIPQYEEFVESGRDLDRELSALQQIMVRPPRIRTETFSASGAGQCLRERLLGYYGYPKEKISTRTYNIFANGDYVHLRHQVAGIVMGYIDSAEVSVSKPEMRLTGTMDGLLTNNEILEIKSINSNGFSSVGSFGVRGDHLEQVHSYMYAADMDRARVVYECKNTQELKEFLVNRDESIIDKVVRDLTELNEHIENKTLPPCDHRSKGCSSCRYKTVCQDARPVAYASSRLRIRPRSSTPSV